jgi:prolyl oligopeptidase
MTAHVERQRKHLRGEPFWLPALLALLALSSGAAFPARAQETGTKCPPTARVDNVTDTYGSVVVHDPYRWLEDQKSPETRAWISAEQKCTDEALSKLPGREELSKRLAELLHTDMFGLPVERAGRYFFLKRGADQDLAQLYMRRGTTGADELLVDPLPWSKDHSASVTMEAVSRDGRLLFYGRREGGQDEVTVHAMDVDTKKELPDVLPSADYFGVQPTPDNKGVYYSRTTPEGPRAFYHEIGTDPAQDEMIYGQGLGKDKILAMDLSEDGRYLVYVVVYGSGSQKSEIYLQDLQHKGPVVPVVNDITALFFPVLGNEDLYIITNWKAPQWHVYSTKLSDSGREQWRQFLPETDSRLQDFEPTGEKFIARYTKNAASELVVLDSSGKKEKEIGLPSLGSVTQLRARWSSPEVFYTYETFNRPQTIFRYETKSGKNSIWEETKAPFGANAFEVEQVWYTSKDGTRVPMFLFHRKGLKKDGTNPTILTGYGGFDLSETPTYSAFFLLWAEHGGIVARANLRGGGEFGEQWHRAGMLDKKQNVFDDFEAAAEYLIANKYTSADKLAIYGNSNGGLLVGTAMTQKPELFRAVVCGYPLLDMLRYQKFLDGPYWVPEYGSADNPAQFPYLYAYSPYQHVKQGGKYPATLFVTGDGDTRVAPLHARKMTAELQADNGSRNPILILYDTKSGHSGGRPVNKIIEEQTDILSFLFWQLGVKPEPGD